MPLKHFNQNEGAGETAGTLDRSENSREYEDKLSTKQKPIKV